MYDLHVKLPPASDSLARLGEAMGAKGVSLEGGGVFTANGVGHAHFLVEDGRAAQDAAQAAGLEVVSVSPVLVRKLDQERTGQLGAIARALGDAGVTVVTQYSDHQNRLILVADDQDTAERVTAAWAPA